MLNMKIKVRITVMKSLNSVYCENMGHVQFKRVVFTQCRNKRLTKFLRCVEFVHKSSSFSALGMQDVKRC